MRQVSLKCNYYKAQEEINAYRDLIRVHLSSIFILFNLSFCYKLRICKIACFFTYDFNKVNRLRIFQMQLKKLNMFKNFEEIKMDSIKRFDFFSQSI